MIEQTIYVQKPKSEVIHQINGVPQALQVGMAVAKALSEQVRIAFLAKSLGGSDETGARWKPLAPSTIAKRLRKQHPTTARPSSTLSESQREQWWEFYRRALARTHDKSTAAKIAWSKLKRRGGSGAVDKHGASGVLILRDTDALYESLKLGAAHNILRVESGSVEYGSSRPGATAHHRGAKNLPQRRLWPKPDTWTAEWWQDILSGARDGVIQFLTETL